MKGYVLSLILGFLPTIINNPKLQAQFAEPIGKAMADVLPDITEDAIGHFLIKIGESLKAQN